MIEEHGIDSAAAHESTLPFDQYRIGFATRVALTVERRAV